MRWIADIRQDVRYALRTLRASPGFAAVTILTLGLGIGATTAIYSVVDAVLLKPLPFADSGRLVRVVENLSFVAGRPPIQGSISYEQYVEWRARTATLTDTMAFSPGLMLVRTSEGTARLWGAMVSANTFTVLQTRAMLGRTLDPADEAHPDVVVLGFDTWRRFFQSNPGVVGTTIELQRSNPLDRRLLTVVGVMPAAFEFPTTGMDYYTPIVPDGPSKRWPGVTLIGRLRPGVSMKAAMDEAGVIGNAIRPPRANLPALTVPRFEVQGLKDQIVKDLRPALRVLLAVVVVVLLIVCANVANLLLARGTARQREIAVRFAVGAGRGRIARQVLTECVVLATAGGALGALLAVAEVALVKALGLVEAPGIFRLGLGTSILPRGSEVGVDPGMFAVAFAVAATTSLLFGVLPALHLSRTSHLHAMGPRGGGSRPGESRIRAALVVGQVVLATVLLIGAGLLIRSYLKLSGVERGYDASNILAFQLVFPPEYSISRKADTIDALLARLRASPKVESAGFTRAGMLINEQITLGIFVPPGRTPDEMRAYPMAPSLRPVSPGYLTATGARLLEGHDLPVVEGGRSMPAIVISRTVARRFSGAGSPVGQVVAWHMRDQPPVELQVVGVVEDLRNTSPDREPYPEVFIGYRQLLPLLQRWGDLPPRQEQTAIGLLSFAVRTRGDPAAAVPDVGRIIRAVDPRAGIDAIIPLDRLVGSSVARQRFSAVMLGVFAAVAGLLAAIGIYGVLAYAVVQRTHEIGIRMALGARRAQVVVVVLRQGLILSAAGIALGLAAAAAGTRMLQSLLFGITPLDPQTFAAVAVMFGLVAGVASYAPARRATTIDPMVALRSDRQPSEP